LKFETKAEPTFINSGFFNWKKGHSEVHSPPEFVVSQAGSSIASPDNNWTTNRGATVYCPPETTTTCTSMFD